MQAYRLILLVGTLSAMLMASACTPDMATPSDMNTSQLKVRDQTVTEIFSTDHVDLRHVAATARNVLRNGNKDVTLTIPYLPGGETRAVDLGTAYKNAFAAQGATHVSVVLVAMTDSADTDKAVASYEALVTVQAEDCGRIPGYQGTESSEGFDSYQYGCETQAAMGQMIEDPSDLLGKQNAPDANSRRNGAIIEPYMLGTPNTQMKGMSASSIGTTTQ